MSYGDTFRALDDASFREGLKAVADDMVELLSRKRQSYGPDNLTRFGEFGILIRLGDKVERLAHMYRQGISVTAVGEDADDAWRDILGYAMLRMLVQHAEDERRRARFHNAISEDDATRAEEHTDG